MAYFKNFILVLFILSVFWLKTPAQNTGYEDYNKLNQDLFNCLNYSELVDLSKSINNECLKGKINIVLNNSIVDNSIQPEINVKLQNNPGIGKYIRVASWNINRSFRTDSIKSIFLNPCLYLSELKTKNPKIIKKVREQIKILQHSDIIILNEVDAGMPRSGYKIVVEELAKALGYNYAYGVEFLEVDPAQLGLESYRWSEKRELATEGVTINSKVDKCKYKGLHGNAILSRFPLKNVKIVRLPQSYDWYNSEKLQLTRLEKVRRYIAEKIFKQSISREIRIGGRIALIADFTVPELNIPITVVATHLEDRASPKYRNEQVKCILKSIKNIRNPVILAGDFNTSSYSDRPLKPKSFLSAMILVFKPMYEIPNILRRYSNPTVKNIPVILPNKERAVFDTIEEAKFDFRGKKEFSSNSKGGLLSDSNERGLRGFKPTFIFGRSFGFAKYKLDWIFVKSCSNNQPDKKKPCKLTPFYGRTLYELNYSQKIWPSDHAPITLDIPLQYVGD